MIKLLLVPWIFFRGHNRVSFSGFFVSFQSGNSWLCSLFITNTNVCKIPLSQLPLPCAKGDRIVIFIPKEYRIVDLFWLKSCIEWFLFLFTMMSMRIEPKTQCILRFEWFNQINKTLILLIIAIKRNGSFLPFMCEQVY
jgi:hypothetical protein